MLGREGPKWDASEFWVSRAFNMFFLGSISFSRIIRCAESSILVDCAHKLLIKSWSQLFLFRSFPHSTFPSNLSSGEGDAREMAC
jgi:hypothetical protein